MEKKITDEELKQCMAEGMATKDIAAKFDMSVRKVNLRKAKLARQGWSPEHDMKKEVPDGYHVKGTSTLYDADGVAKLQWVKTNIDHARQFELMKEMVIAMAEDLPKPEPVDTPVYTVDESITVYPLGDPHIGMLSWWRETGQSWDLDIAEEKMLSVFSRAVGSAVPTKLGLIVNLGDFFHSDNMEGVTARSGHHLDVDGRYAKMVRVGVKIIRTMINEALKKHEQVKVISATGNHDDVSSQFLQVLLKNVYDNEPRVIIDDSPVPFHYHRHGKVLIGVHHGHSCKMERLAGVMATDMAKDWGETEFRYWLTGHIHHDSVKEYAGVKVESFRTLTAKDSYATWGGYRAGQDMKVITYHKDHGEIMRVTFNINTVG